MHRLVSLLPQHFARPQDVKGDLAVAKVVYVAARGPRVTGSREYRKVYNSE